jgi:hypothetical protein
MKIFGNFLGILSILLPHLIYAETQPQDKKKDEPFPIGNFSVPLITQIAPLVSFGQEGNELLISLAFFKNGIETDLQQPIFPSTNAIFTGSQPNLDRNEESILTFFDLQ